MGAFAWLGAISAHRRWWVIIIWSVIFGVLGGLAPRLGDELSPGGFEIAGSPSDRARAVILERFPGEAPTAITPVLTARPGASPTPTDYRSVAERITRDLRAAPLVRDVGPLSIAPDGRSAFLVAGLRAGIDESLRGADDLLERATAASTDAIAVTVTGAPAVFTDFDRVNAEDLRRAEVIQLPLVLLVLVLVLGSLIAASLPIITTVVALAVTLGSLFFAAKGFTLSIYVENIVPLVGIGVGVDYSLFLVNRFRDERLDGRSIAEAVTIATATSGRAIFFSGLTVIVALAGMFAVGVPIFTGFAIGTIAVVAVAVAAALTLVPAVLAALGDRLFRLSIPGATGRRSRARAESNRWTRWADAVMRNPWRWLAVSSTILLGLAVPVLWMNLGSSGATALPPDVPSIRAADIVARQIGPGGLAPHRILIDGHGSPPPTAAIVSLRAQIAADRDVASVGALRTSTDGNTVLFDAVPRFAEDDARAQDTVRRIERTMVPNLAGLGTAEVIVGGAASQNRDFNDTISRNTPRVIAIVMLLTFLVLVVLFRSILLPLKAVVMTLLSALSAYGVLVMVFQWGWGDSLLGFDHLGHVTAWVPPFLFSILFGLSMDYEVFLLTRVREHYDRVGDDRAAIAWGLARSGAIITAAAAIMMIVFLSFTGNRLVPLKESALGLGVAVFLDATIVRIILVPAFMRIAGRWNWWLPGWLDRILPAAHTEGTVGHPPPR